MIITGYHKYLALILTICIFALTSSASENTVLSNVYNFNKYLGRLNKVDERQQSVRAGFNNGDKQSIQKPKNDGFKESLRNLAFYSSYNAYYGQMVYAYYYSSSQTRYYTTYLSSFKSIYVGYNSDPNVIRSVLLSYYSYSYQSYLSYYSYTQLPTYLSSQTAYQSSLWAYSSYLLYQSYKSYLSSYSQYTSYQYYLYKQQIGDDASYSNLGDGASAAIAVSLVCGISLTIFLTVCSCKLCLKTSFKRGKKYDNTCRKSTSECNCCKKKKPKYRKPNSEYQKAKARGLVTGETAKTIPYEQKNLFVNERQPAVYPYNTIPMNYPQQPIVAPMGNYPQQPMVHQQPMNYYPQQQMGPLIGQQQQMNTPNGLHLNTDAPLNAVFYPPQSLPQNAIVVNGQINPYDQHSQQQQMIYHGQPVNMQAIDPNLSANVNTFDTTRANMIYENQHLKPI